MSDNDFVPISIPDATFNYPDRVNITDGDYFCMLICRECGSWYEPSKHPDNGCVSGLLDAIHTS